MTLNQRVRSSSLWRVVKRDHLSPIREVCMLANTSLVRSGASCSEHRPPIKSKSKLRTAGSLTYVQLLLSFCSLLMRKGNLIVLYGGDRNKPNDFHDTAPLRFQFVCFDSFVNGLARDPELLCGFGDREGFFCMAFLAITGLLVAQTVTVTVFRLETGSFRYIL
jgi:hypothetical protein